ncbi:MAG: response regulator [Planctomycetota bacterium]|nr:response regulator [Planctomycetota bacterium]MDA1106076.1 response regulator [Planctomycetota bacterium]
MTPESESLSLEGVESREIDITGCLILVVDDNQQNLELLEAYLEPLGCRLLASTDGALALDAVRQHRPDMVLLDVMMPRLSGFEVCKAIKGDPQFRDIVVLMVTALHEVSDLERAAECGCDDFLSKPVNKVELLTRVRSLLRVRVLKRALADYMRRSGDTPA